jgi:hypothetical protein
MTIKPRYLETMIVLAIVAIFAGAILYRHHAQAECDATSGTLVGAGWPSMAYVCIHEVPR